MNVFGTFGHTAPGAGVLWIGISRKARIPSTLVLSRPGYALVWLQLAHRRHLDTPLSVSPYGLANPRSACPGQHPCPSREQGCLVWRSDGISDASELSTKAKHILDPGYSRLQSPLALQEQIHINAENLVMLCNSVRSQAKKYKRALPNSWKIIDL